MKKKLDDNIMKTMLSRGNINAAHYKHVNCNGRSRGNSLDNSFDFNDKTAIVGTSSALYGKTAIKV